METEREDTGFGDDELSDDDDMFWGEESDDL